MDVLVDPPLRNVSGKLSAGVKFLLKKNKVDVIKGWGKLEGKGSVLVENNGKSEKYIAKHIILATGARSRELPGMEPDGKLILTSKEAMQPASIPKSMLVIGSGAIGVEFASFYNDLGTKVTIVEVQNRILPAEDEEVSSFAQNAYEKHGIPILTDTKVQKLTKNAQTVSASFLRPDGNVVEEAFEKVISAVGIVGNVENIGLEKTNAKLDGSHIVTDK